MPISKVETFETDITEEIKQKQGFVTDVLAAHSSAPPKTPDQTIIRVLVFAIVFLLIALVAGISYYFSVKSEQDALAVEQQKAVVVRKPSVSIKTILPKTSSNIESFVVKTRREEAGYIITLSDYSSVYGTIINNEVTFGNDLISLFQINSNSIPVFRDVTINNQDMRIATLVIISTSTVVSPVSAPVITPPVIPVVVPATTVKSTSTKVVSTSTKLTSTSTSTKKTSSVASTTPTIATTPAPVITEVLPDVNTTFAYISYGFIGTSTLLISTSQEKLLELRSAIIK